MPSLPAGTPPPAAIRQGEQRLFRLNAGQVCGPHQATHETHDGRWEATPGTRTTSPEPPAHSKDDEDLLDRMSIDGCLRRHVEVDRPDPIPLAEYYGKKFKGLELAPGGSRFT